MTYFCFIESAILSVPHMEPLAATTNDEALLESVQLMRQHSSAIAAHVLLGENRIGSVMASDASAARDHSDARQNAAI